MMTAAKITDIHAGRQWQQVLERDPSADGQFFYAVRSTGIVCRPTCPSRRPTRANVQFFPTLAEAIEAGFRPCRRCQPERTTPAPDPQAKAVARAARYLDQHTGERVTTEQLAAVAGTNRLTLHRAFQRIFGVSPAQYARQQRHKTFDKTLRESTMRVTDAIYDAGFGSSSRLYETSDARLGMTPREMRNGAHGIAIRYTIADSPLGRMLVASTDKGICNISFGENEDEVLDVLQQRYPNADIIAESLATKPNTPQTSWLASAVAFITSQLTEHPTAATFPLDVRATAFQQRVWNALQTIPRGETRSYSELAAELGSPNATRAVASACASNPVAIIVPCHRVIGKNGALTGYRWGTERKRRLLEAESLTQPASNRLQ
ncbi:MAG TPA: bifunctional DNA-binding transcriptional regulator/O6-methylguanine-DNA methyltransferase Ada [Edaphobacter sp.]|jgi:AraC family transcriptional regulator of adaptative response/methylated-DNA-[protein]-cysteine methyltransferase|nr:bifunctional DNA-binding transcriptional regulator/O6-methylguanine-DNA methyltransferase Ada [Edaphobacter sp.]